MSTKHEPDVRVGQVWADNDRRSRGRTIEIVEVGLTKKRRTNVAPWLERKYGVVESEEPAVRVRAITVARNVSKVGSETTVLLSRFRPNSTGYQLVRDVEADQ